MKLLFIIHLEGTHRLGAFGSVIATPAPPREAIAYVRRLPIARDWSLVRDTRKHQCTCAKCKRRMIRAAGGSNFTRIRITAVRIARADARFLGGAA